MGRLTEYFYYMNNNCTKEWMDLHFVYYTPTHEDEKLKKEISNRNKESVKNYSKNIFGD